MSAAKPRRGRGFTLLESVIALAVLSVGLLGAAGMLLDSLRIHTGALRRLAATQLVRDMADRIRANVAGRELYDTRTAVGPAVACVEPEGCDVAQIAAADRAKFAAAAAALLTPHAFSATVEFVPATGPATPDCYVIVLHWRDSRDVAGEGESVALQVLAQPPVAG
jgi:type IV pilus modification protein PilV